MENDENNNVNNDTISIVPNSSSPIKDALKKHLEEWYGRNALLKNVSLDDKVGG